MLLLSSKAQAAPVTYSCQLLDGRRDIGMYSEVDQVVIDPESPLIDLSVARTMGTSIEVNWIFTTRPGHDGSAEIMTMRRSDSGALLAVGMDTVGAYSFRFYDGYLLFAATYVVPALAFTWKCEE